GGSRLKILEALAMKKAVVSTPVGCEGLNVFHEKNILIADTPEVFASRTIDLLEDKKLREQLGAAGRKLVEAKYGWEAISKSLCKIYDAVVKDRKEE
ncbi:MAG: glycosyltransferase, partial [Nitrospirae bacterium]|nr:glycosyltransferase [Nitrospirota bacterium]